MFSFLRKNPESRKVSLPEREADGFVFVGETANEKRTEPEGVALFLVKGSSPNLHPQANMDAASRLTSPDNADQNGKGQTAEGIPLMAEFLNDVPFTLAPHVLEIQSHFFSVPEQILNSCVNDNLSRFLYDFTLENSVLCEP